MDLHQIAARITELRAEQRLSQAQLAARAKISRQTLSALEGARKPEIGFATLTRVLDALGLELTLIGDERLPTRDEVIAVRDAGLRRRPR